MEGTGELPGDRDHGDVRRNGRVHVSTVLVVLLIGLFFPILHSNSYSATSCGPDLACHPLHGFDELQTAIDTISSTGFVPSNAVVALTSSTEHLLSQIKRLEAGRHQKDLQLQAFSNNLLQLVVEGTTLQGSVRDGRSKLLSSAHQVDTALRDMEDFYDVLQQLMASDAQNRCVFVDVSDPQNSVLESKRQKALESTLLAQLLWSELRKRFFKLRQDIATHRLHVDSTHNQWNRTVVNVNNSVHVAADRNFVDTAVDIAKEVPEVAVISLVGGAAGGVVGCAIGAMVSGGVGCAPGAVAGAKAGVAMLAVPAGVEKVVDGVAESYRTHRDVAVLRDIEGVDLSATLLEYDAHLSRMEESVGIVINHLKLQSDRLRSIHNETVFTDLFTRVPVGDLIAKVKSVRTFTGRVVEQMTLTQESAEESADEPSAD